MNVFPSLCLESRSQIRERDSLIFLNFSDSSLEDIDPRAAEGETQLKFLEYVAGGWGLGQVDLSIDDLFTGCAAGAH